MEVAAGVRKREDEGWTRTPDNKWIPPSGQMQTQSYSPPSSPTRVKKLTRPTRPQYAKEGGYFRGLPRTISVPEELQTQFRDEDEVYRLLERAAYVLYSGDLPVLVSGGPTPSYSVAAGSRRATWALSLFLGHAPDDRSRIGALRALGSAGINFDPWDSPSLGWFAIAQCFEESRNAHAYAAAFRQDTFVRDTVCATLMESGDSKSGLAAAVGLKGTALPESGWASRSMTALWNGLFATELRFEHDSSGDYLDGPSWRVLFSAAVLANADQLRRNLVQAIASQPGIFLPKLAPFCSQFAVILAITQPMEYRSILMTMPPFKRTLIGSLPHLQSDNWATPKTRAFLGSP